MKYLSYGLYLLTALTVLLVAYRLFLSISLLTSGVRTIAVVIDHESSTHREKDDRTGKVRVRTHYFPIVEFKTENLEPVRVRLETGSTKPEPAVGDSIDIIYRKQNPQKVLEHSFAGLWGLPIVLAIFAIFFGIGARMAVIQL